jgi:thiol-disulfide isomerase/thioredoxin
MVLVKQIKSANVLEDSFDKSDSYFLFIYANWCGHCKEMKPDMENFKKEASRKNGNVFIGCIEDTAIKNDTRINEVLTKYNIEPQGYPTIVYGKKNEAPTELKGERNLKNFNKIFNELCKGITRQSGGRRRKRKRKSRKTHKKRTKRKKRRRKKKTKKRHR